MLPTVYQGMYNAITRDVERELFPALRRAGMRFYAYNPLAGGLLTGKYPAPDAGPSAGRFTQATYRDRYWRGSHFRALEIIRRACQETGSAMTEAALCWLRYHSFLKGAKRDGVILGASGLEQFDENLKNCGEKRLNGELTAAFDQAWEVVRPECPKYFRP
jgi:aflatoxin B1 aldehyde reductase